MPKMPSYIDRAKTALADAESHYANGYHDLVTLDVKMVQAYTALALAEEQRRVNDIVERQAGSYAADPFSEHEDPAVKLARFEAAIDRVRRIGYDENISPQGRLLQILDMAEETVRPGADPAGGEPRCGDTEETL
jgi:hypothetical protein